MSMRYRAEIDGLRALSVIGVIVFHADLVISGVRLFPGGYLGVDIFFVISGYLISSILLSDLDAGTLSFRSFYMRRVRRILPALYLVLGVSTATALALLPPDSLAEFSKSAISALFFVANFYSWLSQGYFSEAAELSVLLHVWSLSVEEQFYLVYPLLLVAAYRVNRRSLKWVLPVVAALSLFSAILLRQSRPVAVFYLASFRVWELLAGALVATIHRGGKGNGLQSWPGPVSCLGSAIVLSCFVLGYPVGVYGSASTVLSVFGACLVLLSDRESSFANRVLGSKPLVWIGLISYSLYLWHQPLFAFARHYAINDISICGRFGLVAATALLAVASWLLVERPFRKPNLLTDQSVLGLWIGSTALMVAVYTALIALKGLPERYTEDQRSMLDVSAERGTLALTGQDCQTRSIEKVCLIGNTAIAPSWAVLGDSHAETLSDALSDLLEKRGVSAEVLTYPGCPYILGVDPIFTNDPCASFAEAVLEKIKRDKIKTVVINDRANAYMLGTRFDNQEGGVEPGDPFPVKVVKSAFTSDEERIADVKRALTNTIEALLEHDVTVIYIAPVPEVGWNVPHAVTKLLARGRLPLATSKLVYLERNREIYEVLRSFEARSNFLGVYPEDVFCAGGDGRCITHTQNRLPYTDTDHLSREGASMLIKHMADRMQHSGLFPRRQ